MRHLRLSFTMRGVPVAARWLGLSGLIPFVALAVLTLLSADWRYIAAVSLLAYGTAIASFMAGIHWGIAMARKCAGWQLLGMSVIPCLVAWVALLIGGRPGLLLMAVTFIALLAYDLHSVRRGLAPSWYPALRYPLTGIVSISLLVAAFAV